MSGRSCSLLALGASLMLFTACGGGGVRTLAPPAAEPGQAAYGLTEVQKAVLFGPTPGPVGSAAHSGAAGDMYWYIDPLLRVQACRRNPSSQVVCMRASASDMKVTEMLPATAIEPRLGNFDPDPEPTPNQVWVVAEKRGLFRNTFLVGLCSAAADPHCSFSDLPKTDDIIQQPIAAHVLRLPAEQSVLWLQVLRGRSFGKDGETTLLRCTGSAVAPTPQCTTASMLEH